MPSSDFKLRVTLFLFLLIPRKYAASLPANGGPQDLVSSPFPGCSILIISAPMSPRFMVQNGPAKILLKSRTLIPLSGPFLFSLILIDRFFILVFHFHH